MNEFDKKINNSYLDLNNEIKEAQETDNQEHVLKQFFDSVNHPKLEPNLLPVEEAELSPEWHLQMAEQEANEQKATTSANAIQIRSGNYLNSF